MDKIEWGTFTRQFKAYHKKHPEVKDLKEFAELVVNSPKGFHATTKKRANFYLNYVINPKRGKGNTCSTKKQTIMTTNPTMKEIATRYMTPGEAVSFFSRKTTTKQFPKGTKVEALDIKPETISRPVSSENPLHKAEIIRKNSTQSSIRDLMAQPKPTKIKAESSPEPQTPVGFKVTKPTGKGKHKDALHNEIATMLAENKALDVEDYDWINSNINPIVEAARNEMIEIEKGKDWATATKANKTVKKKEVIRATKDKVKQKVDEYLSGRGKHSYLAQSLGHKSLDKYNKKELIDIINDAARRGDKATYDFYLPQLKGLDKNMAKRKRDIAITVDAGEESYTGKGKKRGSGWTDSILALAGQAGNAANLTQGVPGLGAATNVLQGIDFANQLREATGATLKHMAEQAAPGASNNAVLKHNFGWLGFGKPSKVTMNKKDYLHEHHKLIALLNDMSVKAKKEANKQSAEVKQEMKKGRGRPKKCVNNIDGGCGMCGGTKGTIKGGMEERRERLNAPGAEALQQRQQNRQTIGETYEALKAAKPDVALETLEHILTYLYPKHDVEEYLIRIGRRVRD